MSKQSMPIGYKIFFGAVLAYIAWQFVRPKPKKDISKEGQRTSSGSESQESQETNINQGGYAGGGYYGGGYSGGGSQVIQMTPQAKTEVVSEDPVIIPSMPRINPLSNLNNVASKIQTGIKKPVSISTPSRGSSEQGENISNQTPPPPRTNPYETKVNVKRPVLTNTLKTQIYKSNINQNLNS